MKITLLIFSLFLIVNSYTQNNVGVGTLTPNPNAALEIQSADKGLLIPRLTTTQRNIFGTGLTNTENSMLVYDVNDSVFYYWKSTVWIPIPGINTDNQNIDSVTLNPLDSVLTVYIEDGLSASLDLKTAFDNTDEQTLSIVGDSLEISNGNRVLFIDNDTTNEKIDSVTYLNDTLTVYEGDSVYKTEIIGGEWADADKIGSTDFIYAKQALNNGTPDTVVISDKGNIGVGFTRPTSKIQAFDYYDTTQIITPFVSPTDRLPGISVYDYSDFVGLTTVDKDNNPATTNGADGMLYWGDDGGSEDLRFAYMRYNTAGGNLLAEDKMIIKGGGNVGIGTTTPTDKLQINGNVRVGVYKDLAGGAVEPEGWGNLIHFSGGPDVSPGFNSDNSDGIYMGRYNILSDLSELRIRLGDNLGAMDNDAFVIGSRSQTLPWTPYFRVQSNGFTGIGENPTTYPTNQLHVIANANPLRLEGLQQGATTDSVLTVSNTGVVRQTANPMPAGSIISFAGATSPDGFLICDGSAVSRTAYANLFAVIGTTYGAGNGTTTFNLPDLRGEFIRGADAGRGVDPGRALGTNQLASPVVGDDNVNAPNDFSMQMVGTNPQFFDAYDPAYAAVNMWYSTPGGENYNPPHAGFMRGTRPRNVALNYIIRY